MSQTPTDVLLARLREAGKRVDAAGPRRWTAQCPAHEDRNPSLSIAAGDDGRALVKCHAGCATASVVQSLGLTLADLSPASDAGPRPGCVRKQKPKAGKPAKANAKQRGPGFASLDDLAAKLRNECGGSEGGRWAYQDREGCDVLAVLRFDHAEGKTYRPAHCSGDRWHVGDPAGLLPLYRLPELLTSPANSRVYVCEGEKAAEAARRVGLLATCSAHGSKAAAKSDWSPLAGRDVVILPDSDEPGRAYAKAVAKLLLEADASTSVRVVELPDLPDRGDIADLAAGLDDDELAGLRELVETLADEAQPIDPAGIVGGLRTVSLADVESKPISWLWQGRFPLGKLALISGDPGLGKSFLTLSIASHVTTGKAWPIANEGCPPRGDVLLLTAEDSLSDTIKPRLLAAGADLSRVRAIQAAIVEGDREAMFSLERDLPALEATLKRQRDTRLLIIDPITAYMGGVDSHKQSDIRGLLSPLTDIAERYEVAVLMVAHLNKSQGLSAQYRTAGSVALPAACRFAYLIGKHPDDEQKRVLAVTKCNLAKEPQSLAYSLVDAHPHEVAAVRWDAEPVQISVAQLTSPSGGDGGSDRQDAETWLREALAGGPALAKELQAACDEQHFSWRTVQKAKAKLDIRSDRQGFGKDSSVWWRLPGEAEPIERSEAPIERIDAPSQQGNLCAVCEPTEGGEA